MTQKLTGHYEIIWRYEKAWAYSVAAFVQKSRPITVWEVMLPVFLIFNWARRRVDRDIFCQNILWTKKMALDAALDMLKKGISKEEALVRAGEETTSVLSTAGPEVYSENIRKRQLEEVGFLADHYRVLLASEGGDYGGLVRRVYSAEDAYLGFLETLGDIERKVNQAALETVGERGDPTFIEKIEDASRRYRLKTAGRLFSG